MRFKATMASQLAVIGIWLLISTPALSQDYARNGFYVGAGVLGGNHTKFDNKLEDLLEDELGVDVDVENDTAVGFELYGGYRFHPNFAIEAEFEMLPEADIDIDIDLVDPDSPAERVRIAELEAELESWTITVNLKAFWPIRRSPTEPIGRIHPFVLVGIGAMRAEIEETEVLGISESESGFVARFGGGLDFYLTEHIVASAGADYLLPTGDLQDLDLAYVSFGGGLQYRF